MIKAKAMSKLTVFGPKTYMKPVIETLYDMNVVHIEDYTKKTEEDFFDIGAPFDENEEYAEVLVKLRTLISNLTVSKTQVDQSSESISLIKAKTDKIYTETTALLQDKEYFSQILKIYNKKDIKKALNSLKIEDEIKYNHHFIGFINLEQEPLQQEIEKNLKKNQFFSVSYSGITLMALFVDKKTDKIMKLLDKYDFSPIDAPVLKEHYKFKSKPGVKFVKLNYQVEKIQKSFDELENEISRKKVEHSKFLLGSEKKLSVESEKAEAPLRFASSKNTFLIKGWVPNQNKDKLSDKLEKVTKGKVHLEYEKPNKKDKVPIAFNHPKIVEPFEAFMDLYTLPSYKEIDPTFFMFLTFPIFFGFMLGDVGYGLVIFGLFSLLKKKMPGAKNFLNAFLIAAVASIIFGMVFGEYFGYEEVSPELGHKLGIHPHKLTSHGETKIIYPIPHIFSRSHRINDLLSMGILFGVVHILIGLVIGFVNIYKAHGFKHAFFEKAGWVLLMPTMLYLLTDFLGVITGFVAHMLRPFIPPMNIMLGSAIVAVVIIIKGEGARGAVELPALLSNILSYARLMAVGLASLSLALVVNDLAGQMFQGGVVGIISGILILILGHTINIALGVLSPFLHSLRLHYVEFFTKFFHGGGRKYKTFGEQ